MTLKKTILVIFFIFHIVCVNIINLCAFSGLGEKEREKLNPFGKRYVKIANRFLKKNELISCYTNFTGTNRGYEFFSPNISRFSLKIKFLETNGKEIPLYNSFESTLKFGTASYYLNSNLFNENLRNEIFESYCKRIFAMNENITKINIVLQITEYNDLYTLYNNGTHKEIHLCTVTKL